MTEIKTLQDLCKFFSADSPDLLNRRIYKGTACGAWISVRTPDGEWHDCGDDWSAITEIDAFKIGTIVEGSDADVVGDDFELPVSTARVDGWIEEMESEATHLWENANYDWFTVYATGKDSDEVVTGGCDQHPLIVLDDDLPGLADAIRAGIDKFWEENTDSDGSSCCWDEDVEFEVEVEGKAYTVWGYRPSDF